MRKYNVGITVILFAVLCILCGDASASTVFYYTSSPESWVGQGESATVTPNDGFAFIVERNYCNGVSFHINNFTPIPDINNMISWHLNFAAPYNVVLQPGQYENAIHFTYQYSEYPGLAFYGKGRANGSISGYFNVYEAVYGDNDEVISFAADFMQYDEGVEDAWSMGGIRYNSDYPIPESSTIMLLLAGFSLIGLKAKIKR
ncbi:MAG TPA: hypothetical protein PLA52_02340 [Candidatus Omnitrophota bacterium]|nr:hypothetical protein [Candidatus Omnitrophota bacterium]HOX09464.1 hypothetical protein [Candidatus Omnitrophota bacterium]HRZ66520.1 hypothetical protein [Candidatus Omnitrophota bacterium]